MPHHHDVREHARVSAVAIRKRMNRHDTIVEADRDLIGRIRVIVEPAAHFLVELSQFGPNPMLIDTDVCPSLPELAGSLPYVAEHLHVQSL